MSARVRLLGMAVAVMAVVACSDDDDDNGIAPVVDTFAATLTGSAVRPTPVTTPGTGTATFRFSGDTLYYSITVSGLLGDVTSATIHGPATDQAEGDTLVTLQIVAGTGTVANSFLFGPVTASVSVDSLVTLMRNGSAYLLVASDSMPSGELRGQIRDQ